MLAGMYRISLSDDQRCALRERTRQAGLAPSTRDRLEMVRLSDAGWSVPHIARHLGQHEQTVRAWIKAFLAGGFDALPNKPRGGQQSALTAPILGLTNPLVGPFAEFVPAVRVGSGVLEIYTLVAIVAVYVLAGLVGQVLVRRR